MKRSLIAIFLLAGLSSRAFAQRETPAAIPADVANAIAFLYNAADTRHERGAIDIASDSVVAASLVVRGGPVVIAGHIEGSLVVINGDLTFQRGARVDGQVYVVGGTVEGRELAQIGSDFRAYAESMRYHLSGDQFVAEDDEVAGHGIRPHDSHFWSPGDRESARFDVFAVASSGVYNRVEGYPFVVGPRLRFHTDWGSMSFQARGIVRTAEPVEWNRGSLGHDLRAEARWGTGPGVGIGVSAFDRIDAVESWQMSDRETGLAAVGIQRDYRDYYSRHGGRALLNAFLNDNTTLSFAYGAETWESRDARDPWTVFRDREAWRPNPAVDDGYAHLLTSSLRFDTRNQAYNPGNGWFIQADVERGHFQPVAPDPGNVLELVTAPPARSYTRGFLDARRYNRLAPGAQLNVRLVAGGWLGGDELPLERRLSVGGPGTLPGFDFQKSSGSIDRLQCNEAPGASVNLPARCDRVALVQVEYRGDLSWTLGHDDRGHRWSEGLDGPTWLIFADAGRGWRARDDGVTTYPIESLPSFSTFKTDLGMGLDFGSISVSLAKSLSDHDEPMNVIVRLSRRF